MVIVCMQQQIEDEDEARNEIALWAGNVLSSCGESLSNQSEDNRSMLNGN